VGCVLSFLRNMFGDTGLAALLVRINRNCEGRGDDCRFSGDFGGSDAVSEGDFLSFALLRKAPNDGISCRSNWNRNIRYH
jgi:hypothetical protein